MDDYLNQKFHPQNVSTHFARSMYKSSEVWIFFRHAFVYDMNPAMKCTL